MTGIDPRPVLYLDIDDTLLIWSAGYPEAADGAAPFLLWALDHYEVRWLSTWCPAGELTASLTGDLCNMVGIEAGTLARIGGFDWREGDCKLNGIAWLEHVALDRPFVWVEDDYGVGERELRFLTEHGFRDCYLRCNVTEDPGALTRVHERLRNGQALRARAPASGRTTAA